MWNNLHRWKLIVVPEDKNLVTGNPYGLIKIPFKAVTLKCYPYGCYEVDKILVKYNIYKLKIDLFVELALCVSSGDFFDTPLLEMLTYEILLRSMLQK